MSYNLVMLRVAFLIVAATVVALPAQDAKTPVKQAKPAKKKLPPFPKDKAKWVIRGKARVDALPARVGRTVWRADTTLWVHRMTLGLGNVCVRVRSADQRWRLRPPRRLVWFTADRRGIWPQIIPIMAGQRLAVSKPQNAPGMAFQIQPSRGRRGRSDFMVIGSQAQGPLFLTPGKRKLTGPFGTASIMVFRHPFFAVTEEHGRFTLPKLPDGDYELVAIHELLGEVTKKITIAGKNPKPVTFVFKVPEKLRAK